MKYTYINGYHAVTQEVLPLFTRYHACHAQHAYFKDEVGNRCYLFVSYSTPMAVVLKPHNGPSYYIFNDNPFGYSATTSRQVSRWLREVIHLDPYIVRDAYEHSKPMDHGGTYYSESLIGPMYLFMDDDEFRSHFFTRCDAMRECHADV